MAAAFTIRIFVPDGDPEGVRIIDKMNWTGIGIAFPRAAWTTLRSRPEMKGIGVYILTGYDTQDEDLPKIYIGQADGINERIDSHADKKDFWDSGIVFVSANRGLNRAHVTWLEYALIKRAIEAKRCHLDNGNTPQEPVLTEAEKADTQAFLKEILQILPLAGLRAFEIIKPVVTLSNGNEILHSNPGITNFDTIIVPAQKEGFERVFLGEDCWHAIRISGGMLDKIRFIAAYQSQPVSAVTHFAKVDRIEPYGEGGKYKVIFSEKAEAIGPIPYADAPMGAMQGPRYSTFEKLKSAKKLTDLLGQKGK
ncbi:MAG TPA: GIY-YIG nuclease family protein [bacterium]|jgi:hypothetical protein|nr:GIY-YIG nuclease family protein [bacterium]